MLLALLRFSRPVMLLMTFFSSTTAVLIIYALYELALHQEIQDKVFKEVRSAIDGNDGKLDYQTLNELNYLDMVVSEVLRKYPPGLRVSAFLISVIS